MKKMNHEEKEKVCGGFRAGVIHQYFPNYRGSYLMHGPSGIQHKCQYSDFHQGSAYYPYGV